MTVVTGNLLRCMGTGKINLRPLSLRHELSWTKVKSLSWDKSQKSDGVQMEAESNFGWPVERTGLL